MRRCLYLFVLFAFAAMPCRAAGVSVIDVGGRPFEALPSLDGSALFVSVQTRGFKRNEVQVYGRSGDSYTRLRAIQLDGTPLGMALTPDGKTLLVAGGDRYAAISTAAAMGNGPVPVAQLSDRQASQPIEVVASLDGRYAFFSDEESSSVGVVAITPATSLTSPPTLQLVGFIPVDHMPVGLALSPDGRTLYVTSEFASGHPLACGRTAMGTLSTIDVAAAEATPASSVRSSTLVGCDPVRVAVSPDGASVWVTVRGDNRVDTYDAAALAKNADGARLARTPVGTAPVGLMLTADGKYVMIANSNRFDRGGQSSTITILDARASGASQKPVVGSIPTGAFPRELRESPHHDAIYLTNYAGGTVEIIPEPF